MRPVQQGTGLGQGPDEASYKPESDLEQLRADLLAVLGGHAAPTFCFQPIADLERGVVAGYEALVRFPTRVPLAPDVCLEAAGRFGIGEQLERLIATEALRARRLLPANAFLSINVSPGLLCSASWANEIVPSLDLSGVVIEITEAELIRDYQLVRERIADIYTRGGMVAIDDAGAGYASLKHILELRPNFIKLDRSLVQNCDTDRAKATVIEVLGAAANRMDAWVITEGVETAGELSEVVRLGVPLAQGYFLGRPQKTMAGLTDASQDLLRAASAQRTNLDDLLLYADTCLVVRTREEALRLLSASTPLVAVVDAWDRPMELLEQHDQYGVRLLPGAMRCHHRCAAREALQRALTRPAAARFDPLVLTDGEGRLRGAVRLDRLMQAVLSGTVPAAVAP